MTGRGWRSARTSVPIGGRRLPRVGVPRGHSGYHWLNAVPVRLPWAGRALSARRRRTDCVPAVLRLGPPLEAAGRGIGLNRVPWCAWRRRRRGWRASGGLASGRALRGLHRGDGCRRATGGRGTPARRRSPSTGWGRRLPRRRGPWAFSGVRGPCLGGNLVTHVIPGRWPLATRDVDHANPCDGGHRSRVPAAGQSDQPSSSVVTLQTAVQSPAGGVP